VLDYSTQMQQPGCLDFTKDNLAKIFYDPDFQGKKLSKIFRLMQVYTRNNFTQNIKRLPETSQHEIRQILQRNSARHHSMRRSQL